MRRVGLLVVLGGILATGLLGQSLLYSPAPGVYANDQVLMIKPELVQNFEISWNGTDWKTAPSQLNLGAMVGETRTYRCYIRPESGKAPVYTLDYTIDRQGPKTPLPRVAPGTVVGPLIVRLEPDSDRQALEWRVSVAGIAKTFNEDFIQLDGQANTIARYDVQVRGIDAMGNAGPWFQGQWTIDRSTERENGSAVRILSPSAGVFANRQVLILDDDGFSELRYSLDGTDPKLGSVYSGPVEILKTGRINVRVWGLNFLGKETSQELSFTASDEDPIKIKQGLMYESISVSPDPRYQFAVGDQIAGPTSPVFSKTIRLSPQPDSLRLLTLTLYRKEDKARFRYAFLAQGISPLAPEASIEFLGPDSSDLSSTLLFRYRLWARSERYHSLLIAGIDKNIELSPKESGHYIDFVLKPGQQKTIRLQSYVSQNALGALRTLQVKAPNLQNRLIQLATGKSLLRQIPDWPMDTTAIWFRWLDVPWEQGGWFVPGNLGTSVLLPLQWQGKLAFELVQKNPAGDWQVSRYQGSADSSLLQGPIIKVQDRQVSLVGNFTGLFYRSYLLDGIQGRGDFVPWTGQVDLIEKPGQNLNYRVEAYGINEMGLQSEISLSPVIALHTKAPSAPIVQTPDKVLVRNMASYAYADKDLSFIIVNTEPGVVYRYTLEFADGEREVYDYQNSIVLNGRRGKDSRYSVKIRAISAGNPNLASDGPSFAIQHDRELPMIPILKGIEPNAYYGTSATFTLNSTELAEYSIESNGKGAESYRIFDKEVTIKASPGRSIDYILRYRGVDSSGNRSQETRAVQFTLDSEAPPRPSFRLKFDDGLIRDLPAYASRLQYSSNRNVQVLPQEAFDRVEYRLTKSANAEWQPWSTNVLIQVINGEEQTHVIELRAIDKANNISEISTLELTIDGIAPPMPMEPQIVRDGNQGVFRFAKTNDGIEYRLNHDGPWINYALDIDFTLSAGKPEFILEYRSIDNAGNVSKTRELLIGYRQELSAIMLDGISDGATLPRPAIVQFKLNDNSVKVRFAIDTVAKEITMDDRLYEGRIELPAIQGSEQWIVLSWRSWKDGWVASPNSSVRILLDAKAPLAPISNVRSENSTLEGPLDFHLDAQEAGDTIQYAVSQVTSALGSLADVRLWYDLRSREIDFKVYSGELVHLEPRPGTFSFYRIEAYSVDAAGNRSAIARWNLVAHPGFTFVQPGNGASGKGTLLDPFTSFETANASATKDSTIVLGKGNHLIPTIKIERSLYLIGGFDFTAWQFDPADRENPTLLYPQSGATSALISIQNFNLAIKDLYFVDNRENLDCLIDAKNARLEIDSVFFGLGRASNGIKISGGFTKIQNSRLSLQGDQSATLINAANAQLDISASVLEQVDVPPSLRTKRAQAIIVLLAASKMSLKIEECLFKPGFGNSTRSVVAHDSNIEIQSGQIYTGSGSQSAGAIELHACVSVLRDVQIQGDIIGNHTVLIQGSSGELNLTGGAMNLAAKEGSFGIVMQNCRIGISNLDVQSQACREFANFASLNDCRVKGTALNIRLNSAKESIVARLVGATMEILNSTIQVESSTGIPVQILEASAFSLKQSTLRTDFARGAFLVHALVESVIIENCTLVGFRDLFLMDRMGSGIISISEDTLGTKGSIPGAFVNNQIQKGL